MQILPEEIVAIILKNLPFNLQSIISKDIRKLAFRKIIININNVKFFDPDIVTNVYYNKDLRRRCVNNIPLKYANKNILCSKYANESWFKKSDVTFEFTSNQLYVKSISCNNFLGFCNFPDETLELHVKKISFDFINLPSNLRTLTLSKITFNKKIEKFPERLENLSFVSDYNYSLDNLPLSLKMFQFNGYCSILQDYSYTNIALLSIRGKYTSPILGLPKTLIHLNYYSDIVHKLPALPPNMKILNISGDYDFVFENLPHSLFQLTIYTCDEPFLKSKYNRELPSNKLYYFNPGDSYDKDINRSSNSINRLYLGRGYNGKDIDISNLKLVQLKIKADCRSLKLGTCLKRLSLTGSYNQKIIFPDSLEELELNGEFDGKLNLENTKLNKLITGDKFNENFVSLPLSLKRIKFGKNFNQSIDNLPDQIELVEFVENSNYSKNISKLPINIKRVYMPISYNNKIILNDKYDFFEEIYLGHFGVLVYYYTPKPNILVKVFNY